MKYPCILPVLPSPIVPPGSVSQAPGLGPAIVTKLPFLNCSTTVNVPSGLCLTVKSRLNVSVAQSFPHVLESGEVLGPRVEQHCPGGVVADDLAIEIVSPGQSPVTVGARCGWYVEHGTGQAVLVDPERRTVHLYTPADGLGRWCHGFSRLTTRWNWATCCRIRPAWPNCSRR
jgi:hypothetical protein